MAAIANLPLFIRLGHEGDMVEIGQAEFDVTDGRVQLDRASIADLLRQAADAIEQGDDAP